jgi:hypothetical protein
MIMCALARHEYAAARGVFSKMSDPGREDRTTRYLMYKVALQGNDPDLGMAPGVRMSQGANQSVKLPNASILYVGSHQKTLPCFMHV